MSEKIKHEKHEWIKNGTSRGKVRYKCKICNKTCGEQNLKLSHRLLNMVLQFINNFPSEDTYFWEEAVDLDEEGNELEAYRSYNYKIEKLRISWKDFKKMVDSHKRFYKPLAVFLCELDESGDWRDEKIFAYEVHY